MRRLTKWIAVGLLAGCGGDDSTITGGDSGASSSGGESSDGSDVSADSSGAGPESSSSADADTSSSSADSSSGSSGGGAVCGDGLIEATEECDDDNDLDGDACSSVCTTTFELLWTVSYDGVASSFDSVDAVLLGPDDTIYVIGRTRTIAASSDVWVQQIMPDGTLGWTFSWDGADGLSDVAHAAAWTADGDIAVVGSTESEATGEDILVLVLDPDTQGVVWTQTFDGPGSGPDDNDDFDNAEAVAIDPDGNLVVAGSVRIGPNDFDVWVGEYTPDGMELRWSQTYAGDAGDWDQGNGVLVDELGNVNVVAYRNGLNSAEPIVLFFDTEGVPQVDETIVLDVFVNGSFRRDDGVIAITGSAEPANTGSDLRAAVLDADWNEQWFAFHTTNDTDVGLGVAIDDMGGVAAAGWQQLTGESLNAWVGGFREDGTPWWGDAYNNDEANLNDVYEAVAIDGAGDVIAAGSETVFGQQTNAFIRKYRPI